MSGESDTEFHELLDGMIKKLLEGFNDGKANNRPSARSMASLSLSGGKRKQGTKKLFFECCCCCCCCLLLSFQSREFFL
jgi:hypothetical protein